MALVSSEDPFVIDEASHLGALDIGALATALGTPRGCRSSIGAARHGSTAALSSNVAAHPREPICWNSSSPHAREKDATQSA